MEIAEKIKSLSEKYKEYTVDLLAQMVRLEGYSGTEGKRCELIVKLCKEIGFDEVKIDGIGNVIAKIGNGSKIMAFDAHIDTVENGDVSQWTDDPQSGIIRNGYLYGRGSCDQLGGAASMMAAGKILKEIEYDGEYTIYFTFTVMEEDCDGLCWIYLVEEEKLKPDFIISTEPSECQILMGHRGRMEIEVLLKGISAHGSVPHLGDSAAYKASKAALAIEKLDKELQPDTEDLLGKGSATVSSIIVKGPSQCSVPDEAMLYIDRRLTLGEDEKLAINQVESYIENAIGEKPYKVYMPRYEKRGYTNLDYGQELYFPTWVVREEDEIVKASEAAYEALYGVTAPLKDRHGSGSTNGVAFAGRYGIPAIIFGPGEGSNEAHKPNEKMIIDHLVVCSAFYAMLPYFLP